MESERMSTTERAKKEANRESRYDSEREAERRAAEIRLQPHMNARDPLYISPDKIPNGWEYAWTRISCLDRPDVNRDTEIKRLGWSPVPSSRHPELCSEGVSGMVGQRHGIIVINGLLLCEIPATIKKERDRKQAMEDANKINGLQMSGILMGDPDHAPLTLVKNETTRDYGVRNASFGG